MLSEHSMPLGAGDWMHADHTILAKGHALPTDAPFSYGAPF